MSTLTLLLLLCQNSLAFLVIVFGANFQVRSSGIL